VKSGRGSCFRGLTREAAMGEFSPWHLLIVALVFVLLFGANKLPQMARAVGQSMRIFKAETRALTGEKDEKEESPPSAAPSPSIPSGEALREKPPADQAG
jgi:sec-independent protein translocase protein TatA